MTSMYANVTPLANADYTTPVDSCLFSCGMIHMYTTHVYTRDMT